ncbi:hypothetical protein, partial [Plasticicumulans acidivorans]|uniref:hypothetical protein n=1 Tax=Plasticicumulans acidivorans TaxID=886464 RepID=UPI001B87F3BA
LFGARVCKAAGQDFMPLTAVTRKLSGKTTRLKTSATTLKLLAELRVDVSNSRHDYSKAFLILKKYLFILIIL